MPGFIGSNGNNLEIEYLTEIEFTDRYASAQLWSWGRNSNGQLGLGNFVNRRKPEQVIALSTNTYANTSANVALESSWEKMSIKNGKIHAIKVDGSLWHWSNTSFYTLTSYSCLDVSGGADHSAVITSSGTIASRGDNTYGQIGDGTTTTASGLTLNITGSTYWIKLSCGTNNTLAIKLDGTLWGWGRNDSGQLGDNTVLNKSSPVQTVSGSNTWSEISCGNSHTLAVKTDGTLWSWGLNHLGQLGDGTTINKSSPVQIPGNTWSKVYAGIDNSAAIKRDGTLYLWGNNNGGILGDNTAVNKSSPVQTIAGGQWKQVACGNTHTLGIKTDGTVWSWGSDTYGELATFTSTFTAKSSPVQVRLVGDGSITGYWKQVACGDNFSMMIGYDAYG